MYLSKYTMESQNNNIIVNGVNENNVRGNSMVVTPGRTRHEQQVASDRHPATARNSIKLKVATWNVRTMHQPGKLENVAREMTRLKVDIMGVCEVRWTGAGTVDLDDGGCMIYSGGTAHTNGVGVMLTETAARSLAGFYPVSERVLLVRLKGKPFDTCIIQVYAPTCDYAEDIVEEFYSDVMKAKEQCKPHEVTLVMGDLNAKLGNERVEDIVGPFGLGERNERGDRWAEWCIENEQVVLNTWFRQPPRRLYTWMSPGDRVRNQIDYITINKRFRNAVKSTRTFPGADCNSDHVPIVIEMAVKLKKPRKRKLKPKVNIKLLKSDSNIKDLYNVAVRNKFEALENEAEESTMQSVYDNLSAAIEEASAEILPKVTRTPNRPWMTEAILRLMDDRRRCKGTDDQLYRELNRTIHQDCRIAKERWMDEKCTEVEDLSKRDQQLMYSKVNDIIKKKKSNKNVAIKKADGTIAMDIEDVKTRWNEYVSELYHDVRPEENEIEIVNDEGPEIMRSEVEAAIKEMKAGKAVGGDGVAAEALQALGDFAIDQLTSLFQQIYQSGNIIDEMCDSVFVALPKVEGTLECSKHRTLSIMSQITKILLRIILKRIRTKLRTQISDQQFGFVPGKGTSNALFALRVLTENVLEVQKDIFVCFVDYEKAFDKVKHANLFNMLNEAGIDGKDMRLMRNLYWKQKATVRVGDEESPSLEIRRGVRQGCVLSPELFNLYSEVIMRDLLEMDGIKAGGRNINNIRYADDTVLITDSEEKLQDLVPALVRASGEHGLKLNVSKTKVMVISKADNDISANVEVGGVVLEQVQRYKYLGSVVTKDGRSVEEIKTRIAIAKNAFNKVKHIVTNRSISISLRRRFIKSYVWSTMLYGCEAWTINKDMEKRIEAAEMWFFRRMLKISWTDRVSNDVVLHRAGTKREIMKFIRQRQLRFLGHVMRSQQLENVCMTGRIEGRRGRGRPRVKLVDSLAKVVGGGVTPAQLLRMTETRSDWRSMVADVLEDMPP